MISSPVNSLLIYNTTTSRFKYYNAVLKNYGKDANYCSTSSVDDIGTKSNIDTALPNMSISKVSGKYSVSFASQFSNSIMIIAANTDTLLANFF